jgi:hypothetical protein
LPKIPAGYRSLDEVLAELGPALIGTAWIPRLSERERWLTEKHERSIIPAMTVIVGPAGVPFPPDARTELGAALERAAKMNSRHQQALAWLNDRELLEKTEDGDEIVPVAAFTDALRRAGLAGEPGNAAQRRCEIWLRELATPDAGSAAPAIAASSKNSWWKEAKSREDMRGLSRRAFDRAWARVAAEYPRMARRGAKPRPGSSRN